MRRSSRSLGMRACCLAAPALALGACSDYLARRDTLAAGSGDSIRHNIAVHVIDPWPRVAWRTDDVIDGERLQHVIERYRNPSSGPGLGLAGAPVLGTPIAAPAAVR